MQPVDSDTEHVMRSVRALADLIYLLLHPVEEVCSPQIFHSKMLTPNGLAIQRSLRNAKIKRGEMAVALAQATSLMNVD